MCVITCSLYPCICVAWVLQCTIVFENGRSTCFFFSSSFSSNSTGFFPVLVGKEQSSGYSSTFTKKWVYSYPAFACCQAGSTRSISDSFITWTAQNMVGVPSITGHFWENKDGSSTIKAIFVVAWGIRYLNSNHYVPQGLGTLPSCSVNRNAPSVVVEVLD